MDDPRKCCFFNNLHSFVRCRDAILINPCVSRQRLHLKFRAKTARIDGISVFASAVASSRVIYLWSSYPEADDGVPVESKCCNTSVH